MGTSKESSPREKLLKAAVLIAAFAGLLTIGINRRFEISQQSNPPMPRIATSQSPSAVGAPGSQAAPIVVDDFIKDRCKRVWPDDYRMQKHCFDQEIEAANQIAALQDNHLENPEEWKILARCLDRWAGVDISGADFRMSRHCFERQLAAYRALQ